MYYLTARKRYAAYRVRPAFTREALLTHLQDEARELYVATGDWPEDMELAERSLEPTEVADAPAHPLRPAPASPRPAQPSPAPARKRKCDGEARVVTHAEAVRRGIAEETTKRRAIGKTARRDGEPMHPRTGWMFFCRCALAARGATAH
jgi:hypothetical protein